MGIPLVGVHKVNLVVNLPEWGQSARCSLEDVLELLVPLLFQQWYVILGQGLVPCAPGESVLSMPRLVPFLGVFFFSAKCGYRLRLCPWFALLRRCYICVLQVSHEVHRI
jgi:hypothetical protein